jgi:hypothetical protein
MDPKAVRELLERVKRGETSVDDGLEALRDLPFAELADATVDHHRALRTGFPEVILGTGKTAEQVVAILREIDRHGQTAFATRIAPATGAQIVAALPDVTYEPVSRTAVLRREPPRRIGSGPVCVVSAGTSDLPVAEEAAVTAEVLGNDVVRVRDVGIAGLHRLLAHRKTLGAAAVIVVVAGMEGALASAIGGLVPKPVIAVPTSVGYGASFGGIAALLGMLSSCAAGVTVVNIDNGFGAAYAASLINRGASERG